MNGSPFEEVGTRLRYAPLTSGDDTELPCCFFFTSLSLFDGSGSGGG